MTQIDLLDFDINLGMNTLCDYRAEVVYDGANAILRNKKGRQVCSYMKVRKTFVP